MYAATTSQFKLYFLTQFEYLKSTRFSEPAARAVSVREPPRLPLCRAV